MKTVTASLLALTLLGACVQATPEQQPTAETTQTPPTPTGTTTASGDARVCDALAAVPTLDFSQQLNDAQLVMLRGIQTQTLPPPTYRCGANSYQTDTNLYGTTYTGVGFSADGSAAAVSLQGMAGPLAGAGGTCLVQRQAGAWVLRGCRQDWIS